MIIDQRKNFAFVYPWDEGKVRIEVSIRRGALSISVPEMNLGGAAAAEVCMAIVKALELGAGMLGVGSSEKCSTPVDDPTREQPEKPHTQRYQP